MYLGKYPDTPGALPPGYNGTAYIPEPEPECSTPEPEPCEAQPCGCPPPEQEPECTVCSAPCDPPHASGVHGLLAHVFAHKIDMEDLLLLALIVMMISSGADGDMILMLALLFVLGL